VFRGARILDHLLYVAFGELFGFQGIVSCELTFDVAPQADSRSITWEAWNGAAWVPASFGPAGDSTAGLQVPGVVDLGALAPIPATAVHGIESRWVRARLGSLVNRSAAMRRGMVRASELPEIRSITGHVNVTRANLSVDAAFTNTTPIDTRKDFFPFGETPRFGDTLYVRLDEPLSIRDAVVTIQIDMTNPAAPPGGAAVTPLPTQPSSDLTLSWEVWDGSGWFLLGTSTPSQPTAFPDGTKAFTRSGNVALGAAIPAVVPTTVNGVHGYWLRARIVAGNYGREARYVADPDTNFTLEPATFAPPVVRRMVAGYTLDTSASPDSVLTYNDFTLVDRSDHAKGEVQPFTPFTPTADDRPTLNWGFELPPAVLTFPNRPISIFARAADVRYGERTVPMWPTHVVGAGAPGSVVTYHFTITNPDTSAKAGFGFTSFGTTWTPNPMVPLFMELGPGAAADVTVQVTVPEDQPLGTSDAGFFVMITSAQSDRAHVASFTTWAGVPPAATEPVRLAWEYWNGSGWLPLTVQDDTSNLTASGTIEFLAPPDFALRADFGTSPKYWIRARWERGDYSIDARLVQLLLNTTMAGQLVTVRNETLGSSDGSKNLRFRATRAPILPGQRLEVREPELPSAAERAVLELEEGVDAVRMVLDAVSRPKEIWVCWHQVRDVYASGPRDRHYVVDRLSGELRFGDGLNGLVPPIGIGNIRLASYRTGGGRAGNRPAGAIVQLKTTVPYVDKVTNHEPAAGGADAEPLESLFDRVPREVRHGGRAVTVEDYEDLAHLATPEVARALCVPLANLAADPLVQQPGTPGEVSLIIVPDAADAKPLPSLALIRRVQEFLDRVHVSTARLSVVGPLYVRVDVTAEVAVVALEGATAVLAGLEQRIAGFLHPLTGGLDGAGWDFGRRPHESDFYALLEAAPGVDHIRALDVVEVEDVAGATLTGRFLVSSGPPSISVVFEET
jgi:predicted phage baseplate assembly protein